MFLKDMDCLRTSQNYKDNKHSNNVTGSPKINSCAFSEVIVNYF